MGGVLRYLVVAGVIRLAVIVLVLLAAAGDPARAEDGSDARGCWRRERPDPGSTAPNVVGFCFKPGGRMEGFTFDDGDGWDWAKDWKQSEPGVLLIDDRRCLFRIEPDRRTLELFWCGEWTGEWRQTQ